MTAAVEVPNPDVFDGPHPTIDGLTLDIDGDRCQMGDACCYVTPYAIGWVTETRDDGYGGETEVCRWIAPWRLPDGRLVCEDCAVAWDEGEPV